jgi:hypothetical protein
MDCLFFPTQTGLWSHRSQIKTKDRFEQVRDMTQFSGLLTGVNHVFAVTYAYYWTFGSP